MARDPLAVALEHAADQLLEQHETSKRKARPPVDTAAVGDDMARIARAQTGMPALRVLPPPTAECPQGCPVGQAWMVRALRAEEETS